MSIIHFADDSNITCLFNRVMHGVYSLYFPGGYGGCGPKGGGHDPQSGDSAQVEQMVGYKDAPKVAFQEVELSAIMKELKYIE